jgi:hypothetical protein
VVRFTFALHGIAEADRIFIQTAAREEQGRNYSGENVAASWGGRIEAQKTQQSIVPAHCICLGFLYICPGRAV